MTALAVGFHSYVVMARFQFNGPGPHPMPYLKIADVPATAVVLVPGRNPEPGIVDLYNHGVLAVPRKIDPGPKLKKALLCGLDTGLDESFFIIKKDTPYPTEAAPLSL